MSWSYDPKDYTEREFTLIPEGDYRVRIADVVERQFASGNEGYNIEMEVNGYNRKVWYNLVLDKSDPKRTNQRLGSFFDSFGITDYNVDHFNAWKGKVGALTLNHREYNGKTSENVRWFIAKSKQDTLPAWGGGGDAANGATVADEDLPF